MAVANLKPGDRVLVTAPARVVAARRAIGLGCEATVVGETRLRRWGMDGTPGTLLMWDVPGDPCGWGAFAPWGCIVDMEVRWRRLV